MSLIAARAVLRMIPAEVYAGILLLGAFGVGAWWAYDTGHDRARAAAAQEIADLQSANAAARQVIAQLSRTNRELAEGRAADQQAAEVQVAGLRRERDALRRELDRRRAERGGIYDRDSIAAAWARTGVPEPVADSLRR